MIIPTGLGAPLILPERGIKRASFFQHLPEHEWRTPSQATPKNSLGHENQTRWTATLRLDDGHIAWRGWFDDFMDFDQFMMSLSLDTLRFDRPLQRACTPWFEPDLLHIDGRWEWHQWLFIVGPVYPGTGSYGVPSNCAGISGKSGEFADAIGAGGSGGRAAHAFGNGSGGAGGAWSRVTVMALTPSSTITNQIGVGGAAIATGTTAGALGTDTWLNGANLAASSVGAKGGAGGTTGAGATGGQAASGIGTSKNNGGNSGTASAIGATGGAGAGGPSGAGNNSAAGASAATVGSAANGGVTPAGGAGSTQPNIGGAGTLYDATHGPGGGSGSIIGGSTSTGTGGLYGGGSGGKGATNATGVTGQGGAGLAVICYEPPVGSAIFRRNTRFFTRRF